MTATPGNLVVGDSGQIYVRRGLANWLQYDSLVIDKRSISVNGLYKSRVLRGSGRC